MRWKRLSAISSSEISAIGDDRVGNGDEEKDCTYRETRE